MDAKLSNERAMERLGDFKEGCYSGAMVQMELTIDPPENYNTALKAGIQERQESYGRKIGLPLIVKELGKDPWFKIGRRP